MESHETAAEQEQRGNLQRLMRRSTLLLVPIMLLAAVEQSRSVPFSQTWIVFANVVLGVAFGVITIWAAGKLTDLPDVEADEYERFVSVNAAANGFVSTIAWMALVLLAAVFVDVDGASVGFMFLAIALVSLQFPIVRLPSAR